MTAIRRLLGGAAIVWLAAMPLLVGSSRRGGAHQAGDPSRINPTRERAYRANNLGVAHLEQYDYDAAAAAFRLALEIDSTLPFARTNLALALFYANQTEAAADEARRASEEQPDAPQPHYLLGLIERARNQLAEAVSELSRVASLDPSDVGTNVNLGQVYLQQARFDEALALFRRAIEAEPFNVTAAYNLAITLTRAGRREEGAAAMQRFQALRASAYGVTYAQVYLQQGRYAEATASTGLEADLVDPAIPAVTFVDAPASGLDAASDGATRGGSVTLADVDADGDLDLIETGSNGVRLFRNDRGRFVDVSNERGLRSVEGLRDAIGAMAADYDNDSRVDLFVLRQNGSDRLLHQENDGRFADVSQASGIPPYSGEPRAAAFVDVDHDGDLDIAIGGSSGAQLLRNNGDGSFIDITAAAGLTDGADVRMMGPTDVDNRRDVDLMMLGAAAEPRLFLNRRDGRFRDAATEVGLPSDGPYSALAVADVNKDGFTDFFLGRPDRAGSLALSDGRGRFVVSQALDVTTGALAAQFADVDNDGLLDLVVLATAGPRVLRNLGRSWSDVSRAWLEGINVGAIERGSLALGDVDGDGDTDIVARANDRTILFRNDGGNGRRSMAVRLTARVSNRSAVGSKVELRAGSLRAQIETVVTTPAVAPSDLVFGLGARTAPDAVRVLWPAGILQTETGFSQSSAIGPLAPLAIHELDRKPSSCPYLYTWNGRTFEFVTDFLGGGELGAWEGPAARSIPDSDEYVRIRADQLRPRDGRFELRVTNELEEALFLDRVQLVAIDHPVDIDVYPNEGLKPPPRSAFRLYAARNLRVPAAVDQDGRDVRASTARVDSQYADGFALESIRGYAREHAVTIDVGHVSPAGTLLLLTGWTDYAFSSGNVAAHQRGLQLIPPSLEVSDGGGLWRPLVADIGFPIGRPQTIVVDLTGQVTGSAARVRVSTNMRIYWDRIAVADRVDTPLAVRRLEPLTARLRWRGFSMPSNVVGSEPEGFDYSRVTFESPWKILPGRYTGEGDVRSLVTSIDDRFVVSRPGDEIAVSFDATTPPPPVGWTRTFLLYADGFSKEMDLNSSSPDHVAPLPFHDMPSYPYRASARGRPAIGDLAVDERETRMVGRMIPPLELATAQGGRRR